MKIKNYAAYILFSILFSTALSVSNAQTLRILPLGNSITAGNMCMNGTISACTPIGGHIAVGYRFRLLNLLSAAGYNIDYVGTQTFGNALMADSDCAGFGGISDSELAEVMETGTSTHTGWVSSGPYMNSNPADVVLLHIGTNDILAADTARHDVDRILDAIDDYETSHGTSVMVFLARIISTRGNPCNTNPRVIAYNQMMDNLAASRWANGDQLILVDMECGAGLDYNNDMMDEVHPNQNGYDKMGQAWYNAITAWMGPPGPSYTLNMESPSGSGSVTPNVGTHNYAEGANVSVSATPAAGYEFSSWTGDLVSTANPANLTMNGNKTIMATFTKLSYELTLNTDGSPGASINPWGSITVDHGAATSIEVTALPDGYSFNRWEVVSGSSVSISDPSATNTTVTLSSGDASLRATFVPASHSLTVGVVGEGSVELDPDLVEYSNNSTVNLTAVPASGFNFVAWTGDLDGSTNPASLTMGGDKNITATFAIKNYTLTVLSDGTEGAELNPEGGIAVEHGAATDIEVTAVPDGFSFSGWEVVSGSSVSISDPSATSTTVVLSSGDASVRASFVPASHSLSVDVLGEGNVEQDPDQLEYSHNSTVNLTAVPASGYNFVAWTGDLEGSSNPASLKMDGDKNITANFALKNYTLTILSDGTEGAELSPKGNITVEHGAVTGIEVTTIPEGYSFDSWEVVSGSSVSIADPSSASTTVTLSSGDVSIRANFISDSHSLVVNLTGDGSVEVDPEQVEYTHNSSVNLTAVPASGYTFMGWSGDLEGIGNPASVNMDGDKNITATFARHIRVNAVSIPDKAHIIGDTVEAEIQISNDHGQTISLISGKIGEYPLKKLKRSDSSLYLASFVIYEGGRNYPASEDIPVSKLIISDGQIQSPAFEGSIIQENDPIDASAPKVHSMTVPDKNFGAGDTIVMDILADGPGYLAGEQSSFNYVDLESGRLDLHAEGGSYYSMSYVVGEDDPAVEAGELEVILYLRDALGNLSAPFSTVRENTLAINTGTFVEAEFSGIEPVFYPNPAQNYLDLKPGDQKWTGSRMEIVDLGGRIKIALKISDGQQKIRVDISDLEAGAYLIRIVNADAAVWTAKLMKTD